MSGIVAQNHPIEPLLKSHSSSPEPSDASSQPEDANRPIAPSATPAASRGTEQPRPGTTVCQNCLTTTTPLWRRDENGQILCNACGLFFKLHGRRRPISLKTDVIKSRNRSRNTSISRRNGSGSTKRQRISSPAGDSKSSASNANGSGNGSAQSSSNAIANSSTDNIDSPRQNWKSSSSQNNLASNIPPHTQPVAPAPDASSVPVTNAAGSTTSTGNSTPSTGPVSVPTSHAVYMVNAFDPTQQPTPVRTPTSAFPSITNLPPIGRIQSPALGSTSPPNIQLVRGSMSEMLLPRSPPEGLERVPPLQHIGASDLHDRNGSNLPATLPSIRSPSQEQRTPEDLNKELSTRVSELELVNDLLKRRITDLEYSEAQARRTAMDAQQTAADLWKQLTDLKSQEPKKLET